MSVFFGIAVVLTAVPVFAVDPSPTADSAIVFPFMGEAQTNNINVRSGQSVNYDKIGQLYKGQKVAIFAEDKGWYKILLPRNTDNFISAQYVRLISEEEGEVTGDRVNIRSGAGTDFPVLTQLERGTMIHIIETVNGWYRFQSLSDVYGWVSKEFIVFKSNDISEVQQGVIFTRSRDAAPEAEQKELQKKVESKKVVKLTGVVQRQELSEFKNLRFKLVKDDSPVCFLDGPETLIDDFLRYNVEVEGVVYEEESSKYPFPVVHLQKIQLVF